MQCSRSLSGFFTHSGLLITLPLLVAGCLVPSEVKLPQTNLVLTGNTAEVLRTYKPALAVRGISCLICHARVQSSVITDFGLGDSQSFLAQNAGTIYGTDRTPSAWSPRMINNTNRLSLPWYGNYYGAWQNAEGIQGTLVLPRAEISDRSFLDHAGIADASIRLAELVQRDLGADFYGDAPKSGSGPLTARVTPKAGDPVVQEIDQIYIGAPSEEQILGYYQKSGGNPAENAPGWRAYGPSSSVNGLEVRTGSGGGYVTHSGPVLECEGDVVIKGTLFLNQVTIKTTSQGCRLMVSGSVFIQGQVRYADSSSTQNLQISSARAILMGFDAVTLAYRLQGMWYKDGQSLTRGPGSTTEKSARIMAEARVLGSLLKDAKDAGACPTSMEPGSVRLAGVTSALPARCHISYDRLLLNAPDVESRYFGLFKGVVIAEIALFAPGALEFAYDEVFDSVPVLPAFEEIDAGEPSVPILAFI